MTMSKNKQLVLTHLSEIVRTIPTDELEDRVCKAGEIYHGSFRTSLNALFREKLVMATSRGELYITDAGREIVNVLESIKK